MIEVILREDIKTLGRAGEMVKVKPGYARNYLLPQGLAYEATEGNKKRVAAEGRVRAARDQAERSDAERLASSLSQVSLKL
ncbi:MAG TPA: 50S ribosomal protein L9, partial [Gemmatimonadales bacterium]|nr:50S ribosomal protein L9 [Gemmatimonadales bacterium]